MIGTLPPARYPNAHNFLSRPTLGDIDPDWPTWAISGDALGRKDRAVVFSFIRAIGYSVLMYSRAPSKGSAYRYLSTGNPSDYKAFAAFLSDSERIDYGWTRGAFRALGDILGAYEDPDGSIRFTAMLKWEGLCSSVRALRNMEAIRYADREGLEASVVRVVWAAQQIARHWDRLGQLETAMAQLGSLGAMYAPMLHGTETDRAVLRDLALSRGFDDLAAIIGETTDKARLFVEAPKLGSVYLNENSGTMMEIA